ncbi:glycosyl hydrolase [Cellulomonas endophytica]|uniref:glycosyl hydrolase n=1 Tax=Cellulomonas endophytica TaxID=2494735 RepID=UPI0010119CAC|nr:glycosyl hydrolase [Cellulomonas endophytica]
MRARRTPTVRPPAALAVLAALLVALVALGPTAPAAAAAADPARTGVPAQNGVYTGPGAKGAAGARSWEAFTGRPLGRVLDFLPDTTWFAMTRIQWVLDAYRDTPARLELSVPMLPAEGGATLQACARGEYDEHWRAIARVVVGSGRADTDIRPGWEMNGHWYRWSAAADPDAYVGCFRSLVTAMRSVPGQRLRFLWSPGVGDLAVPAERAWPGAAYADAVSVDVYDAHWYWYPSPSGTTPEVARRTVWGQLGCGSRGLTHWSAFARAQGVALGVSEWGATWRLDGHGGGDNAYFVERMLDWIDDPRSGVEFATYFASPDSADLKHDLRGSGTAFPAASAAFLRRLAG